LTSFTGSVLGLESSANAKNFSREDYTLFKKAGICAPRMSNKILVFQSGVTSVDTLVNPNLVTIARRRMADFIQDSIALRATAYGKKLQKSAFRNALVEEIRSFMVSLLSPLNASTQRIAGYTLKQGAVAGNTTRSIGKGLFRILLNVKILSSLDSIAIAVTAGETVEVEEVFQEAA